MSPVLPVRARCPGCGLLLPEGVHAADCPTCQVAALRVRNLDCHCTAPVPSRSYAGRWACARCGRLADGAT
jgi:hypothetical protein